MGKCYNSFGGFCNLFITTNNNDFEVALLNPNSSDLFLYFFYFIAYIFSFCMFPFFVINWIKYMVCVQLDIYFFFLT